MTLRRFKTIALPIYAACLGLGIYMLVHSLTGAGLVGCGTGSGCDSVMGSLWAYIAGALPVSAPAVVAYLLLLICILFLSDRKDKESEELNGIIWTMMLMLGGAIVGVALWFSYLQIAVLHQFCKYCILTHLLGCAGAAVIAVAAPKRQAVRYGTMVPGLAAAALLAAVQVWTMPSIVYDDGRTGALLPSFAPEELPSVGPADAPHEIRLMFDFQCNHCRALHKILPEVVEKTGGDIRFQLCPVSLSNECNPYVPHGGIDSFRGSCTMAKLGLAVWYSFPEKYPQVEEYLLGSGDVNHIIPPEEARRHIASIVGETQLETALQDERIQACLAKSYELFGRTSSSSKSGIPRLIYDQSWLVPETDSADDLISVIYSILIQ
ncbi:MAG: hypothetical protein MJY88_00775 [Bacteroidales bacterium]|nr:hypothetical protein [Bacteroidales bacterium]